MLAALVVAAAAAPLPQKLWTDAPAAATRPTAPPQSIAQLAKQAMPALVGIVALSARGDPKDPFHDFLERMYGSGGEREQPVRGIGTGFFVRSDGLVATNGHVVEGATEITVQLRSWMGMSVQDQLGPDLAEWFGVPGGKGVVITDVIDGGPAARAGLRPGDVVVSFEGDPIAESYRLRWLTANTSPGRTVKMGIWRDHACARWGSPWRRSQAPPQRSARCELRPRARSWNPWGFP